MSDSSEDQLTKRTRASTSKVRTGCITCKVRHVKCDETKPSCKRCTSTGRKCDGYEPPKRSRNTMRNMMTIYVPPTQIQRKILPLPGWSEADQYHRFVAPKLSGFFDSDFWTKLVLQMSESEPAIRHAIAAVSAMHRDVESLPVPYPEYPLHANPAALRASYDALRSLTSRIQADPRSDLVTLVACVLFTCLEAMRGSVDIAIMHMTNGFNILHNAKSAAQCSSSASSSACKRDWEMIENHVVPVFDRLNLLCMLFGHFTPSVADRYELPEVFASLDDARRRLYELSYHCIRFVRFLAFKMDGGQPTDLADAIEHTKLRRQCHHWLNMMNGYIERHGISSTDEAQAVNLLYIHFRTVFVWLSVSIEGVETAYDKYLSEFEEIVRLADAIVTSHPNPEAQKFSFEMGIIPPLYFTSNRCREPHVRRRALALLKRAPRREGLWNAHIAARVAEEVIKVEESGIITDEGVPTETSRVYGAGPKSAQLPARALEQAELISGLNPLKAWERLPTGQTREQDTFTPDEPRISTLTVRFRAKPWGAGGDWHTWSKNIDL